jgi:hypothetical protein
MAIERFLNIEFIAHPQEYVARKSKMTQRFPQQL